MFCAALSVFLFIFFLLLSTSPPLFSFLPSFFLHSFLICFFFFCLSLLSPFFLFSLSHSSFCLSPLSFFFFLFFLRELLVLSAFQDVIEDTTSCNRMQFIRNKERLVMSMNFPIACLFYITELFEVSN